MKQTSRKRQEREIAEIKASESVSAPARTVPCVICGSATQEGSPEKMCWVCRRLKISAWRETEQQLPAQE